MDVVDQMEKKEFVFNRALQVHDDGLSCCTLSSTVSCDSVCGSMLRRRREKVLQSAPVGNTAFSSVSGGATAAETVSNSSMPSTGNRTPGMMFTSGSSALAHKECAEEATVDHPKRQQQRSSFWLTAESTSACHLLHLRHAGCHCGACGRRRLHLLCKLQRIQCVSGVDGPPHGAVQPQARWRA